MSQENIQSKIAGEEFEISLQCQEVTDQFSFSAEVNWELKTGEIVASCIKILPDNALETANFKITWTKSETNYYFSHKVESSGSTSEQNGDKPDIFHPEFSETLGPLTFLYSLPSSQEGKIHCEYNGSAGEILIDIQRFNGEVRYFIILPGKSVSHSSKII
jgi:hypothetical protein